MTPKLTPREQLIDDRLAALAERAQRIEERQQEILDMGHRLMRGLNELAGYTLTTTQRQSAIATNVDLITRVMLAGRPTPETDTGVHHQGQLAQALNSVAETIEAETGLAVGWVVSE